MQQGYPTGMESLDLILLKHIFGSAAHRANPTVREFTEGRVRGDISVGIALFRIVNITADFTFPFFHRCLQSESKFKESKAYPLKSQITNSLPAASSPSPQENCVVMVTTQRDESFMLENIRWLGDRGLVLYFTKRSLPMTRMIDPTFQKPAILKLPKRVTCPSLR
jgi:hypothetical protein